MKLIDADEFFRNFPELAIEPYINAPTVEPRIEYGTDGQPYKLSMTNGKEYDRPQSEWIIKEGVVACYTACNKCGYADYNHKRPNYCPNCGAKMGGST